MRVSVISTLYNRPANVFYNTAYQLLKNELKDTEWIVVDDGSDETHRVGYEAARHLVRETDLPLRWIFDSTREKKPDTYVIDQNYNNPAHAWNLALEAAQGEVICMLVSDCLIQPATLAAAQSASENTVWCPMVIDIDSGMEFLGPRRLAPFGWFAAWRREDAPDIRQDEEYLKGIAFEDNDFMARLIQAVGQCTVDTRCLVYHQSHPQTAYSDNLKGHNINERYTLKKWGGVPFDGRRCPLNLRVFSGPHQIQLYAARSVSDTKDRAFSLGR